MAKRLCGVFLLFFLSIMTTAPYAWGEVRYITILYSNSINGQIYPAG